MPNNEEVDPPDVVEPIKEEEIISNLQKPDADEYDFKVPTYNEPNYAVFGESFEKYKVNVGIVKWLIGTIGLTLVTFIINWGFKDRAVGLDEIEQYDKYVTDVIVLNKEVGPRRLLAQYFANVTASDKLRNRWIDYYEDVDKEYKATIKLDSITKVKIDSLKSIDSSKLTKEGVQSLESLEQKKVDLEKQLNSEVTLPSEINTDEWIVIAGGDASLAEAQYEVEKAKKKNLNAIVYKKLNMYRTAIGPYNTRNDAQSKLSLIRSNINGDAYIVRLKSWCTTSEAKNGYIECK